VRLYKIGADDMKAFFSENPGTYIRLLKNLSELM
jgi:hypothetical protein